MNDPYRVLGVAPTASDDEIKSAYRQLAKKYHPDNYVNNPLADLAEEKMREINEAFDQIQMMRGQAGQRRSSTDYSSYKQAGGAASAYADVRRLINANRIFDAEEILDGVPEARRDAEWYYLKGSIHYKRAWLEEAMNCFVTANRMDPTNAEYQAALNQLLWQRNTAQPSGGYGGYRTATLGSNGCLCGPCDLCTSLICADCCCECMGGDLIRCC